jgi:hypothetical protein
MSDPIDNAAERATAAIKALADAGHRQANEHAHALDLLRAQVESLRAINAGLRERIEVLEHRVSHTAEVLAMPVDTEAPREVVLGVFDGLRTMTHHSTDRRAVRHYPSDNHGWRRQPGIDNGDKGPVWLNEDEARTWVLDGVLP